jgi:hypothetical protein
LRWNFPKIKKNKSRVNENEVFAESLKKEESDEQSVVSLVSQMAFHLWNQKSVHLYALFFFFKKKLEGLSNPNPTGLQDFFFLKSSSTNPSFQERNYHGS